MSRDDVDKIYAGIVADIAKLARSFAETDSCKLVNGPEALLEFAGNLEGIVAAIGIDHASNVVGETHKANN